DRQRPLVLRPLQYFQHHAERRLAAHECVTGEFAEDRRHDVSAPFGQLLALAHEHLLTDRGRARERAQTRPYALERFLPALRPAVLPTCLASGLRQRLELGSQAARADRTALGGLRLQPLAHALGGKGQRSTLL